MSAVACFSYEKHACLIFFCQEPPACMAQNLLPKQTSALYQRYVELGEGTHTIIMEKKRMNLPRAVRLPACTVLLK